MRQGDLSDQPLRAAEAQAASLSLWQALQAFGTLSAAVWVGVTKWTVWLEMNGPPGSSGWILGMWQATHSLPGEPAL